MNKPVLAINSQVKQYVEVAHHPARQLVDAFTLEALVRLYGDGNYGAIISKRETAYEIGVGWRRNRQSSLQWRSSRYCTSDSFPGFFEGLSGAWVHVAVVYENGEVRAYRNGELYGAL